MQTKLQQEKNNNDSWKSHIPSTRYQGSKSKILHWIYDSIHELQFESVLDAFGRTGVVSCMFKTMNKCVTYNDYLLSNYWSGVALIENASSILTDNDLEFLLGKHDGIDYPSFIENTFGRIYFLDEENIWLDQVIANIGLLGHHYKNDELRYKRALAYHSLMQSCLMKRPSNLFHRKNLEIRTADVVQIPEESRQRFRAKVATHSGGKSPLIPG